MLYTCVRLKQSAAGTQSTAVLDIQSASFLSDSNTTPAEHAFDFHCMHSCDMIMGAGLDTVTDVHAAS